MVPGAEDGAGLEFDWEAGMRASFRVNAREPSLSVGVDFEESFAAPFRNDSVERWSTITDLLGWAKLCPIDPGIGLALNEKPEGFEYRFPLRITEPTADSLASFWARGTRDHMLRFEDAWGTYSSWSKDTTTIVIHPLYLRPIHVEVDAPRLYVFRESRGDAPEVGLPRTAA